MIVVVKLPSFDFDVFITGWGATQFTSTSDHLIHTELIKIGLMIQLTAPGRISPLPHFAYSTRMV